MLIQAKEAHYARGSLHISGAEERIFFQHITKFWAGAVVVEGRAVAIGHTIDADEEIDPHEAMDLIDIYEPEAIGGRLAAQKGEIWHTGEIAESPCLKCSHLWCDGSTEDVCRQISEVDAALLAEASG